MGYILMQPDNSLESFTALKYLVETEECGYKWNIDRPRLPPILFGSPSNLLLEEDYHYFVGKVACSQYNI